jgi:hypothetical protein
MSLFVSICLWLGMSIWNVFEDSLYPFFIKDIAWTSSLWVHENTLGTQINWSVQSQASFRWRLLRELCFSKSGEDSCSTHILCHACFFPWNPRKILIMLCSIGCLNDGSILLLSQMVLAPSESSDSLWRISIFFSCLTYLKQENKKNQHKNIS